MCEIESEIVFFGGTGQFKVMYGIARMNCFNVVGLIDECIKKSPIPSVELYSSYKEWERCFRYSDTKQHFCVTIGNPHGKRREEISERFVKDGFFLTSLSHPSSVGDKFAIGLQAHANSVINPFASIGKWCIVNTSAIVEHDCKLGNAVEIGPAAVLCGNVEVGNYSWIGAGAVVRQNVKIGKNVIVGAGSVVLNDVEDNKVVVGNPAKFLRENEKK